MSRHLNRLVAPLDERQLIDALLSPEEIQVVPLAESVDLGPLDQTIASLLSDGVKESAMDAALVEPLHRCLRNLPDSVTADMRLWHWFTVMRFPEIVWLRWRGSVPANPADGFVLGSGRRPVPVVRFLGTASINGHGRNTFARLFFAAQRLIGPAGEDYSLVRRLFTSQELHLGLSDREYGLLPTVNRVLTRELADLPDQRVRAGVRRLNALGGSFCLDLLEEEEITALVREPAASGGEG
jgi:hypothetical protein